MTLGAQIITLCPHRLYTAPVKTASQDHWLSLSHSLAATSVSAALSAAVTLQTRARLKKIVLDCETGPADAHSDITLH